MHRILLGFIEERYNLKITIKAKLFFFLKI